MWRWSRLGVTPLFTRAFSPSCWRMTTRAYERILLERMHERTLRSPRPLLFRSRDRGQWGGEHTPAASGGGTFWNIRNRSDPTAKTKLAVEPQQLNRSYRAKQLQRSTDQDTAPDLCQLTVGPLGDSFVTAFMSTYMPTYMRTWNCMIS